MKKLIITTVTLFAMTMSGLFAQNSSFIIGVSGGANLSKTKSTGDFADPGESYSRALKFGGGIDIGVGFGKWSILSGLRYNQRGGKTEVNFDDPNGYMWTFPNDNNLYLGVRDRKISYNVLSVPILLRYSFGGENLQVTLSAGPSINILKGTGTAVDEYNLLGGGSKGPIETELKKGKLGDEVFKPSNISFIFSPGIIYKLNDNGNFKFNINFESSSNIANDGYLTFNDFGEIGKASGSIKSGTISFEVGYEHRINFNVGSKY